MGFFDKIKKVFDKGGVGIDVDAPQAFRWSDDTLPLAVQLSNESDEERLVTQLVVTLHEDVDAGHHQRDESAGDRARRRRRAESKGVTFTHAEPVTLAPQSTHTLELAVPLTRGATLGDEAPGWLQAAGDVFDALDGISREGQWFRLKVTPSVEGFNAVAVGSVRLRNLRAGEFGDGITWTHRFRLG